MEVLGAGILSLWLMTASNNICAELKKIHEAIREAIR